MPRDRCRHPLRVAVATCLCVGGWAGTGHGDPVDVPSLALDPGVTVGAWGTTTDPRAFAPSPWNEPGSTVPPLPVPRLELDPPLHGRIGGSEQKAVALGSIGASPPERLVPAFEWQPSEDRRAWDPMAVAYWEEPTGPLISPLSPLDPYDPPPPPNTPSTSGAPPSTLDDQSGWARWNASLWGVSATVLAFDTVMLLAFTQLPTDVTGWHEPEFNGLKKNFTEGPRVDNDRFAFNYIAHPLAGSEYYLIARNRGLNWWQSMSYSAALSSIFEFLIESAYEQAAWQDIWITPVSGTVIGELRWQVKKALENPYTGKPVGTFNKILYVVIDPFDAVYKL